MYTAKSANSRSERRLEVDELYSGNGGNASFNRQNERTMILERGLNIGINHYYTKNIRFTPSTTSNRQDYWNNGGEFQNQKYSISNNQPNTGNYCHLSYYGEEVDKDFLPETIAHQQQSKPPAPHWNIKRVSRFNEDHPGARTSRHIFPPLQTPHSSSSISAKPREADVVDDWTGHEDDAINYRQPAMQLGSFNNFQQETATDNAFYSNVQGSSNIISISSTETVSSFKTAASCFQERQAMQHVGPVKTTLQGWNRVTSASATIKRKVTLHDDDDNHETKLRKRLNRFGEPVEFKTRHRGHPDKVSLDEIIERKNIRRVEMFRGRPADRPSSTWMSGDGRSISVSSAGFRRGDRNSRNDNYYNREPMSSFEGGVEYERHNQPRFHDRRDWNFHGRQWQGPSASGTDSHGKPGRNPKSDQFRRVVIDGANVAFAYGEDLHFACQGIRVCVNYFLQLGLRSEDITVVVPRDRFKRGASKNVEILQDLKQRKMLLANWHGQFSGDGNNSGDDKLFILDIARSKGAIIVSNFNFADIARYNPGLRQSIWNRVVNFRFNSATPKEILFPDIDDAGMYGPTWEDVFQI